MNNTFKYKAFISYSHQDQKFAKWLHRKIENYKIPKALREKYPNLPKDLKRTLFIDDEELPTASVLPDNLSHALESSELLIVVCSPNATQSYWVDKEISYFKQYHGEGKVLAVLKDGEPNATYSSVYDSALESFPKSLRYALNKEGELTEERTEPLAADARKRSNRKKALLKLIAGILKVNFADLWERDKRETKKRRVIYGSLLALFIAVSIYASIQFAGEQGNKELERINSRIAVINYSIHHDDLTEEKVIMLNRELKKFKTDKENKEATQEALGKLETSLGKKADKIYKKKGAQAYLDVVNSREALADQEATDKQLSLLDIGRARASIELYLVKDAQKYYEKATNRVFDYENASKYGEFLTKQNNFSKGIETYKKLLTQKLIESKKAYVLKSLATLYHRIDHFKESERAHKESLEIYRKLSKSNPEVYSADLATSLNNLAFLYRKTNRYKEAERVYKESLEMYRKLSKTNAEAYSADLASSLNHLALLYSDTNRYKEAERAHKESLEIYRKLSKSNPEVYSADLATSLNNLALLYGKMNRYKEAEIVLKEGLEIDRKLAKSNPEAYRSALATSLNNLASLYSDMNRYKEAEIVLKEGLEIDRKLAKSNPEAYSSALAISLNNLASLYSDMNRYKEAEIVLKEGLEIDRKLAKSNPEAYSSALAISLNNLALFYSKTNRYKEGEATYKEALEIYRRLAKTNPEVYNNALAITLDNLALLYGKINRNKEALMHHKTRGIVFSKDNKIIVENIDKNIRIYKKGTSFEPVLGFTNKMMNGKKGIEKNANDLLSSGQNIKLNIDSKLQKNVESLLDKAKIDFDADEVITTVMDSKTGKVITMATSLRYDPSHITQKDVSALNPKFTEYPHEPGSVIKPLSLAVALDHHLVTPNTWFNTYNGKMKIEENRTITDDRKFKSLTVTDIIIHSSNIGISQISWKLTGKEFRDGLLKFGLGQSTGIELSRDLSGYIKPLNLLNNKMHRANTSYGYGMLATFTQLIKAYNVFNNNGIMIAPKLIDSNSSKEDIRQVISKESATQVHNILLEVVKRGTGIKAQYTGLKIGGKTGTAHIAKNGHYVREYHSSFYGFANDYAGHKYTIGVLVIKAKAKYAYFASKSAIPVFKKVVEELVKNSFLLPK